MPIFSRVVIAVALVAGLCSEVSVVMAQQPSQMKPARLTIDSQMNHLLNNPASAAVLEKHIGYVLGFYRNGVLAGNVSREISLRNLASAGTGIKETQLEAIAKDLAKLP